MPCRTGRGAGPLWAPAAARAPPRPPRPPLPTPLTPHPTPSPRPTPPANERTFLSWCSMATTMGGVSSAMVGLTFSRAGGSGGGRVISSRTVDMVSAVYVPLAIMMVCYAFFMYLSRSTFMRKKQVGVQGLLGRAGAGGLARERLRLEGASARR
jgi:uncharacterized membrane protein YidH (DUF202 family)